MLLFCSQFQCSGLKFPHSLFVPHTHLARSFPLEFPLERYLWSSLAPPLRGDWTCFSTWATRSKLPPRKRSFCHFLLFSPRIFSPVLLYWECCDRALLSIWSLRSYSWWIFSLARIRCGGTQGAILFSTCGNLYRPPLTYAENASPSASKIHRTLTSGHLSRGSPYEDSSMNDWNNSEAFLPLCGVTHDKMTEFSFPWVFLFWQGER